MNESKKPHLIQIEELYQSYMSDKVKGVIFGQAIGDALNLSDEFFHMMSEFYKRLVERTMHHL